MSPPRSLDEEANSLFVRAQYLPNKKMDNCQEVTIIHFLLGLCRQLDSMNPGEWTHRRMLV